MHKQVLRHLNNNLVMDHWPASPDVIRNKNTLLEKCPGWN
jgi:hypothetical protein